MPLYRTEPGVTIEDLISMIESRGEEVVSVSSKSDDWVVVTKPMLRIRTNLGQTETRR